MAERSVRGAKKNTIEWTGSNFSTKICEGCHGYDMDFSLLGRK